MSNLTGASILVVEDEPALVERIAAAVRDAGGIVIGPAVNVSEAMALITAESISAAIIDLIVHGVYADTIVRELAKRGIPFAVTTGIGADLTHPELRGALTITKPFQASFVQSVLEELVMGDRRPVEHAV